MTDRDRATEVAELNAICECLKKELAKKCKECEDLEEEIKRLKELLEGWKKQAYKIADEKDELYCLSVESVKIAKVKVLKEFAERLKNEIISDTAYGCDSNQHSGYYDYKIKIGDIPEYIDNLLKEMGVE